MTRSQRSTVFLVTVFCLTSLAVFADEAVNETAIQQAPCCFENPRFSGTCEVTPGPEESCGSILGYLNNPNSVGKNYCGNTKVRGGWSTVACGTSTSNLTDRGEESTDSRE